MAYDNIGLYISRTVRKIIILWTLFITLTISILVIYRQEYNKIQFVQQQISYFSDINNELTSILYYNSTKDKAMQIHFDKTLLYNWIDQNQGSYTDLIPLSKAEITVLENLGQNFYQITNSTTNQIQQYQDLSDQLELLKRLSHKYINESIITNIYQFITPILIGLWLILIFITILIFKNLKNSLISKNEVILEDIWNELQEIELDTITNPIMVTPSQQLFIGKETTNALIEEARMLSLQMTTIKESLILCAQTLQVQIPKQMHSTNPELQEKITYIQKLLSRLFTRAERATSLAKATSDNGFQAGILALNVSIEATRAGETGRNFLSVSHRIKDFAEKSSHIGEAILEELKDADLAIRKAYALGKTIIEQNATDNTHSEEKGQTMNLLELHEIIQSFDLLFKLVMNIQSLSINLEESIVLAITEPPMVESSEKNLEFMKNILIRSFERLYRLNYGIDPPKTNKDIPIYHNEYNQKE